MPIYVHAVHGEIDFQEELSLKDFQVVHEVVDSLGDGPKVAKNGRGEDWWYEDKQVGVFINKM